MAKEIEIKMKFIDLRAQGMSYDKIAKELNVSKVTLIQWSKQYEYEIQNLKIIELEALREKFLLSKEKQLEHTRELYDKLLENLRARNFDEVPLEKITNMLISLSDKLSDIEDVEFTEKDNNFELELYNTKTWTG